MDAVWLIALFLTPALSEPLAPHGPPDCDIILLTPPDVVDELCLKAWLYWLGIPPNESPDLFAGIVHPSDASSRKYLHG